MFSIYCRKFLKILWENMTENKIIRCHNRLIIHSWNFRNLSFFKNFLEFRPVDVRAILVKKYRRTRKKKKMEKIVVSAQFFFANSFLEYSQSRQRNFWTSFRTYCSTRYMGRNNTYKQCFIFIFFTQ